MDPRLANMNLSFQQMPYPHEDPANAYCKDDDRLERSDLRLFRVKEPSTQPVVKEARQVQVQFDPPMNLPANCRDPVFLAALKERSKNMTDGGWKFNAASLSDPASGLRSSSERELTTEESDWIGALKLTQVVDEKRARQAAIDQGKKSLPWETNDINIEDYGLFDKEALDKELDTFYSMTNMDISNTLGAPFDLDDFAAKSIDWPTLLASQTCKASDCEKIPYASFADSGISLDDPFTTEFNSTPSFDSIYDEFVSSPPAMTMEDCLGPELGTALSAMSTSAVLGSSEVDPTFPVQEACETDRDLLRNLYSNNAGLDSNFLDAPYDLEGFATDFNPPVYNGEEKSYGSSCYDPFGSFDVNLPYTEKTQSAFAFPDTFLGYNIPPPDNAVAQPRPVNLIPPGATYTSVNPITSTNSQQSLGMSKQDATCSPDGSAAAENQLLSYLQTDANSTVGNSSPASVQSIGTESESSSDIIASSTPARVSPYQPMGSKKRTTSCRTNLLPEYDSSDTEDGDYAKCVKVLPSSSPSKLAKPSARVSSGRAKPGARVSPSKANSSARASPGRMPLKPDLTLQRSMESTRRELPSTPVKRPFPMAQCVILANSDMSSPMNSGSNFSTPAKRPRFMAQSVIRADYDMGDPKTNGSEIDLGYHFYGCQNIASPDSTDPSTPTTPLTASFTFSSPNDTAYNKEAAEEAARLSRLSKQPPLILGIPLSPPRSKAEVLEKRMQVRRSIVAKEAAEKAAEEATKEAARLSRLSEQPPLILGVPLSPPRSKAEVLEKRMQIRRSIAAKVAARKEATKEAATEAARMSCLSEQRPQKVRRSKPNNAGAFAHF